MTYFKHHLRVQKALLDALGKKQRVEAVSLDENRMYVNYNNCAVFCFPKVQYVLNLPEMFRGNVQKVQQILKEAPNDGKQLAYKYDRRFQKVDVAVFEDMEGNEYYLAKALLQMFGRDVFKLSVYATNPLSPIVIHCLEFSDGLDGIIMPLRVPSSVK